MPDTETVTSTITERLRRMVVSNDEADRRSRDVERMTGEFQSAWAASGVPARHDLTGRSGLIAQGPWRAAYDSLLPLLGSYGVTICLSGTRGTGKTQLAVELARHQCVSGKRVMFRSAVALFTQLRSGFRDEAKRDETQLLTDVRRPKLLVIDEIGKRSESEWENRMLFEVINSRYNDMTDTILTANLDEAEMRRTLGDSIVSRMQEGGGIIECNWPSFRGAR